MVRYQGIVYDSARWEGFETRPSDIFICTPPKCGATWMQMIVALLVFQEPELPDLLSRISPWIDMTTDPAARCSTTWPHRFTVVHQDPHAARRLCPRSRT